jgi:hypothetical protein
MDGTSLFGATLLYRVNASATAPKGGREDAHRAATH